MPFTFTVPKFEYYDEENDRFIEFKERSITIEHSLMSIAKWESKWHKPYISNEKLTEEQAYDYLRCMTLTQNVKYDYYYHIPESVMVEIKNYLENPMTAATFKKKDNDVEKARFRNSKTTAEEFYYDMTALQIPFDPCEKWHINRLIALIQYCSNKNKPPKKMSAKDRTALNNARRKKHHTKG